MGEVSRRAENIFLPEGPGLTEYYNPLISHRSAQSINFQYLVSSEWSKHNKGRLWAFLSIPMLHRLNLEGYWIRKKLFVSEKKIARRSNTLARFNQSTYKYCFLGSMPPSQFLPKVNRSDTSSEILNTPESSQVCWLETAVFSHL